MTTLSSTQLPADIQDTVYKALTEDIGYGDITAQLIPEETTAAAKVITRENAILCGQAWANEVYRQLNPDIAIDWLAHDGELIKPNQVIFTVSGPARDVLTGERTALNFLQTLSGTATICRQYAKRIEGTSAKLLDTRKTIPGLRTAQKYATVCGGCHNHRIGLFDAFLIKENHIKTCGSILKAVQKARSLKSNKPVEVEVENFEELRQAIEAEADIIMLDNFEPEQMREAVKMNDSRCKLEASGNINQGNLREVAETGVDFISIGALTKNCRAIDLSMRVVSTIK